MDKYFQVMSSDFSFQILKLAPLKFSSCTKKESKIWKIKSFTQSFRPMVRRGYQIFTTKKSKWIRSETVSEDSSIGLESKLNNISRIMDLVNRKMNSPQDPTLLQQAKETEAALKMESFSIFLRFSIFNQNYKMIL
jgi:hypothetical protein